jgi:flagellin-like hook-associated protein FlgL
MRIPYDSVRDGLNSINQAAELMAAAQREVSTGRRINVLSDDPLAAQLAVAEHATLGAVDAYSQSVAAASARLASG